MSPKNEYQPESVLHPGITLGEKLQEIGMGPKEFAVRTGKPEKTVTALLKGESAVTPERRSFLKVSLKYRPASG